MKTRNLFLVNKHIELFFLLLVLAYLIFGISSCHADNDSLFISAVSPEDVEITIVYDNYEYKESLTTAWGFSCMVKTPGTNILFDTGGDGSILLSNMQKLDLKPEAIDKVVISHIHSDHLGGLDSFLQENCNVEVFIPKSFPESVKEGINSSGARSLEVQKPAKVSKYVCTTGEMGFWIKEQGLVINTEKGLVVITGCAHPGIVDIVKQAQKVAKTDNVYFVMGGFHLHGKSDKELKEIIREFKVLGVEKVAPSHCSGDRCRELFQQEYQQNYIRSGVGKTFDL